MDILLKNDIVFYAASQKNYTQRRLACQFVIATTRHVGVFLDDK